MSNNIQTFGPVGITPEAISTGLFAAGEGLDIVLRTVRVIPWDRNGNAHKLYASGPNMGLERGYALGLYLKFETEHGEHEQVLQLADLVDILPSNDGQTAIPLPDDMTTLDNNLPEQLAHGGTTTVRLAQGAGLSTYFDGGKFLASVWAAGMDSSMADPDNDLARTFEGIRGHVVRREDKARSKKTADGAEQRVYTHLVLDRFDGREQAAKAGVKKAGTTGKPAAPKTGVDESRVEAVILGFLEDGPLSRSELGAKLPTAVSAAEVALWANEEWRKSDARPFVYDPKLKKYVVRATDEDDS